MIRLLLLAATAYGAAIPQNPSCLERCVATGGVVGAAADLFYFKSVAVDINNFCNVYTSLLKCASECSQDDLNLLMNHTVHASYVCKDKMEELKTVHDCLEADTADPLPDCSKVCQVTDHVPLRLDSSANAPVNPTVPAEGTSPICEKQMCVVRCARESLNKQCAGAGDLFRDVARHQVSVGWELLQQQSENANDTASQLVALSYLANLPEKCVFLTNLEVFDKQAMSEMEASKDAMPTVAFSNDTDSETAAPAAGMGSGMASSAIDAPAESAESGEEIHEQPKPAEGPTSAVSSDAAPERADSEETGSSMEAATEAPLGDGASGLVPSRPVTEEDKDKEEESEEEKPKESAAPSGETGTSMEKEKGAVSEEKDETMPQTEEGEEKESAMEGESKEDKEEDKEADGMHSTNGETTTQVIVVDDEDAQIQANAVTPVTETAKVNGAPSTVVFSSLLALLALIAL